MPFLLENNFWIFKKINIDFEQFKCKDPVFSPGWLWLLPFLSFEEFLSTRSTKVQHWRWLARRDSLIQLSLKGSLCSGPLFSRIKASCSHSDALCVLYLVTSVPLRDIHSDVWVPLSSLSGPRFGCLLLYHFFECCWHKCLHLLPASLFWGFQVHFLLTPSLDF